MQPVVMRPAMLTGGILDRAGFSPVAAAFLWAEIRSHSVKLVGFLALSLVAAIIELTGVGLVFPLLVVLVNPDYITNHGTLSKILAWLGIGPGIGLSVLLVSLIAALMVAKNAYMVLFNWLQYRLLANWKTAMSRRLMEMYIFADYSLHLVKNSSEIIRNIALATAVYDHVMAGLISVAVNSIALLGLVVLLLFVMPYEAIYGVIAILVTVVLLYRVMRKPFSAIGAEQNALFKQRQSILRESIGMFKETKISAKERYFLNSFGAVEKRNFLKQAHNNFLSIIPPLVIESAVVIAILSLVSYILFLSDHPTTGLAILGLLTATLFRMTPLLNRIISSLQLISLGTNSVEILARELIELEGKYYVPTQEPPPLPFEKSLELRSVSYKYPTGNVPALEDISLVIRKDETLGIAGASGSGKTTLAALIMALLPPDSGQIFVDDVPLVKPEQVRAWHQHLGYVAQGIYLIDDTIARNVDLGVDGGVQDEARIWGALEVVQLKEFVEGLPDGINHFIGEDGTRLSGGQRQRLGIARAIYADPDVLVLDEATSALDVAIEKAFSDNLARLKHTRTLIVIAHRLSTLRDCDRIVMLDKGKVLDIGSFQELENRCDAFRRLVRLSQVQPVD